MSDELISAILIPKEVFCGDQCEYHYRFYNTSQNKKDIFLDSSNESLAKFFTGYEESFTVHSLELKHQNNESVLILKLTPWKIGNIDFPQIIINDNVIQLPTIFISSILQKTAETSLQPVHPPILVPGTTYTLYIIGFFLLLLTTLITIIFFKHVKIKKSIIDFFSKKFYSKNYKKTIKKLQKLKKNFHNYSLTDFAQKIQTIFRFFFTNHFKKDFYSNTTSELLDFISNKIQKTIFELNSQKKDNSNSTSSDVLYCNTQTIQFEELQTLTSVFVQTDKIRFSKNNQDLSDEQKNKMIKDAEQIILFFERKSYVTI